jgi:hypothetical protein
LIPKWYRLSFPPSSEDPPYFGSVSRALFIFLTFPFSFFIFYLFIRKFLSNTIKIKKTLGSLDLLLLNPLEGYSEQFKKKSETKCLEGPVAPGI